LQEAAKRERNRLEEQRRQYEEQIRVQREAVLRAEEERMRRLEEAQEQIQRNREAAMKKIAEERRDRERLENLRMEVENKTRKQVPQVQASQPKKTTERKVSARTNGDSSGTPTSFTPKTYEDFEILRVIQSRTPPDPSLPAVPFTKRAEGVYFLGLRKCLIEEFDYQYMVKVGSSHEDLISWYERNERLEGLRSRGMKAAQIVSIFPQVGFAF